MEKYIFDLVKKEELKTVYNLIDDRIKWMDLKNIKQWNVINYWETYPEKYYEEQEKNKNLYVLKRKDTLKVVGAVVIFENDIYWENERDEAYYIHNFVTDIDEKGAGKAILTFIEIMAKKNKKDFLRLDCAVSNKILNLYYEKEGFILKGKCEGGEYIGNKREKIIERD